MDLWSGSDMPWRAVKCRSTARKYLRAVSAREDELVSFLLMLRATVLISVFAGRASCQRHRRTVDHSTHLRTGSVNCMRRSLMPFSIAVGGTFTVNIIESVQTLFSSQERVVERFYERFLKEYPELRHHFESRDLKMQASIVTMALVSVEAYYTHRFPATEHDLRVLGNRHFHNGIRPEDFPKFWLCFASPGCCSVGSR